MNEEDNIDDFVKKVLELQEQKSKLNYKDLHAIAQELGVSIETLEAEIKKYQQRGEGFLKFENLEDALLALEHAYTLNPESIETLKLLARAYFLSWKRSKATEVKSKAIQMAEEILEQDSSNNFAFALISHIKKIDKNPALINQDDSFLWKESKKEETTQNPENQEVKKIHEAKVKYTNSSNKTQNITKLEEGQKVKYNDYEVIILKNDGDGKCKIRYIGWGNSWDEWVNAKDIC